ncbi:MAG: two pore domain potassium channel family protein, partial [Bdellovibrionales bacterium]|nr:two pore domain potassium channel family protein [Bdellovibrionales bacterium]
MKLINSGIHLNKIILKLILGHSFLIITIFGNLIIMSFSFTFYWIEANLNNSINSILDAIWWGFSTATTVGYGDIIPVTSGGKILGIILMLIGTALFATYTALFARAILEDEIIHSNFNVDQTEQDEFLEDL